ncbi:30S ribosomal protein S6 [Synechocystis sp. B12]|nr:30S ribosomal protein S6 [Synechocystis sp. B12]
MLVNSYELMVILRPDLNEERVSQEVTKYQEFLTNNAAEDVSVKVWGKRRLAYQIRRFNDGIYVLFNFNGEGQQIALIERDMRLNDNVMRFLSIKLTPEKPEKEKKDKAVAVEA